VSAAVATILKKCPLRIDEALLKKGCEGWKQPQDAGRRWIAEIVFFSITMLAENILSTKSASQVLQSASTQIP